VPGAEESPRTRGLSVATKIFLSFTAIIAAFSFASAFTLYRMGSLRESVTVLWRELVPTTNQLRVISRQIKSVEDFLAFRREADLQWLQQVLPGLEPFGGQFGLTRAGERLERLATESARVDPQRETLRSIGASLRGFAEGPALYEVVRDHGEPFLALVSDAPGSEQVYRRVVAAVMEAAQSTGLDASSPETRLMVKVLRRISRELNEEVRALGNPIRELDLRIEEDHRTSTWVAIVIALAALVLSFVMLWVIQMTLRPIRELRSSARRIAAGDYAERVGIRLADEIGELAEEFNTMARSLEVRDAALREKQQELLRAERLAVIGKIAAQITHEIRNPLSSIGLNAELLEEEFEALEDPEAARAILASIAKEVDRLKTITEDYLQFARVPRSELGPVSLSSVLDALLVFVDQERLQAEVELTSEREWSEPIEIIADSQQVRQALINVIRNAFEALRQIEGPRRLRIASDRSEASEVGVIIEDNGPGIQPSIRARMFEPFVSDKASGTGLGMALTRDILVAHGGRILVDSPIEGGEGGTRVVLTWKAVRGRA